MDGRERDVAGKLEQLAALRRELRALEAEVGAVVDDCADSATTDPQTVIARARMLTEAERIAQVGSWAWHVASGSVHWSDEMFRIFGVDPENHGDLLETFYAGIHPDDRARAREVEARLLATGRVEPTELRLLKPDGSERTVRTQNAAVLDANGAPVRFVGTVHDLTELRRAERQRRRDEEMLHAAESLAGVGSFRWVPATGETVWSAQLREIAALPEGVAPSIAAFLAVTHPEDRARLEAAIANALATGSTETMHVRLLRPDGSVRHVRLQGHFLPGGAEMLGAVLDVTEVRRLEAELFQAQKLEALGRLAGGIAHDFNNILAVLRLGFEAGYPRDAPLAADLDTAIDRGAALTRQLLAFSRKSVLEPRPVDVAELLQQSVALVSRLLGDAVQAHLELEPEPLIVHVDPVQLQHALINLMVNARDAMPAGGAIWLRARSRTLRHSPPGVSPALPPGEYVELEVRDEGSGIDDAVMPHIFEPFFTTKAPGRGTGLGLATVFGTVSQSGGGLGVSSRAGAGSTFRLYLPRSTALPSPAATPVVSRPVGHGERVLVLDDLPTLRRALVSLLEDAGFEVVPAADPAAVVADAAWVAATCDALVTDMDMPGHSGPDVARALWEHVPTLPVLFISGHPVLELPGGVPAETDFLRKPFSVQELLDHLAALLERARA